MNKKIFKKRKKVIFMEEAQKDIRRKLQKLEGFAGMNASQLLKVACKVFVNQDQEAQKEVEQKIKEKGKSPGSSINWTGRTQFQSE
jgi:hypothetical protein